MKVKCLPQNELAVTERKEEEKEDDIFWQKHKKQERGKKKEIMTATLRPIQR